MRKRQYFKSLGVALWENSCDPMTDYVDVYL